jgi:hypothetical protein
VLRLREGLSVRRGDFSFCYRRLPRPPAVRYAFQALSLSGKPVETFSLGPGEKHRVQEWLFTQADDNRNADKAAVLVAKRLPATRYGTLGLLAVLVGTAGWMTAQFRLRRHPVEPPWMDLTPECGEGTAGSDGRHGSDGVDPASTGEDPGRHAFH